MSDVDFHEKTFISDVMLENFRLCLAWNSECARVYWTTMSFEHYKERVCDGDTIILYLGFDNMLTYIVRRGNTFQTKYGAIKCNDLIGTKYGKKFQCARGFVYVLHPTPEIWTLNVPHRTQILYSTDISMITLQLDLCPGSIVVEAGTGSGSLSHAIIRNILPAGHLHTFEFHEQRVEKAQQEFKSHGLKEYVTITHRDVVENGFQLNHIADAVFLDLPSPWSVISSAKQALKITGGRICSFSPCIEQVQRTSDTLKDEGFTEVSTVECLVRNFDIRNISLPLAYFGDTQMVSDGPSAAKKRTTEISNTSVSREKIEDSEMECCVQTPKEGDRGDCEKNVKVVDEKPDSSPSVPDPSGTGEVESFNFKTAASIASMPGHTGYLTFATLYPSFD